MTGVKIIRDKNNRNTVCMFEIDDKDMQELERARLQHADKDIPYESAADIARAIEIIFRRLHDEAIDRALDQ